MSSVTCTFKNEVNVELTLIQSVCTHGEFATNPPNSIGPNETVTWTAVSDGAGVEGTAQYTPTQPVPGATVTQPIPEFGLIQVSWDNPVAGSNSYGNDEFPTQTTVGSLNTDGGSGTNAAVTYTFTA